MEKKKLPRENIVVNLLFSTSLVCGCVSVKTGKCDGSVLEASTREEKAEVRRGGGG